MNRAETPKTRATASRGWKERVELALWLLVAGGLASCGVLAIVDGSFHAGRRGHRYDITARADPGLFWFSIVMLFFVATLIAVGGIIRFKSTRNAG